MVTARIALLARDGVFFKDGRGWSTSATQRARGYDWPFPATVRGALRGAYGRRLEDSHHRPFTATEWVDETDPLSLGWLLALRRGVGDAWSPDARMWPVPSDALHLEGQPHVYRLVPRRPTASSLGMDDDARCEDLWVPTVSTRSKPKPAPRWWTEAMFVDWLLAKPVAALESPERERLRMTARTDVQLAVEPGSFTALQGALFSSEVTETFSNPPLLGVSLMYEWAYGVEASIPSASDYHQTTFVLGGHARTATSEDLEDEVFAMPERLSEGFEKGVKGLRIVHVTPAIFGHGWMPDAFIPTPLNGGWEFRGHLPNIPHEMILRAALVPRALGMSGWDMQSRAPRKTERLVPAGTTYFVQRADGARIDGATAQSLWGATWGTRTNEGFGRVVPGVWND